MTKTKTKKLQQVAVTINEIYEKHYVPYNRTKHELMCNLKTELEKIDELKKLKAVSTVTKVSETSDSVITSK